MLAYTPVSEAGGVAKTTSAAALGVSHARAGHDVLLIDMDAQNGSLSYLLDVDYDPSDGESDNLVRHMIDRPRGGFEDLIHTVEHDVDIIPSNNMIEDLGDYLQTEKQQAEKVGDAYNVYNQLYRVLSENDVNDDYDVLIVDTDGRPGKILYNALVAVRNVVITFEANAKGEQSIDGLDQLVDGLEEHIQIDIGVLAVLPVEVKGTKDQEETLDQLDDLGFDVPATIRDRTSMVEGSWKQQCSLYTFFEEHRNRQRDYERQTLDEYDALARHLEAKADLEPVQEVV